MCVCVFVCVQWCVFVCAGGGCAGFAIIAEAVVWKYFVAGEEDLALGESSLAA